MKQFFSICLMAFLGSTQLHAQTPLITKTTGFPIGAIFPVMALPMVPVSMLPLPIAVMFILQQTEPPGQNLLL